MSLSLNEIQTLVRWEARDSKIDLTDASSLAVFNMLYRRMSALFLWPELTRTDSSLSTTSGDSTYTWPSTNRYIDVTLVEMQNPFNDNKYDPIMPARTEITFAEESTKPNGFPTVYRRTHDGTNHILEFAPAPDTSSLGIRIKGLIEPTALADGGESTVFLTKLADDALVFLIAADYAAKREDAERSNELLSRTAEILTALSGREILPSELKIQMQNNNA